MALSGLEVHEACTTGDSDSLEEYLRTGKHDPNMRDPEWQNRAPLHWACAKGYIECVRLLLDYGAKGTARMNMGWTPAHCAAEAGKLACLRILHTAGVPVNRKDKYGDTPRRVAEVYGHHECAKYLGQVEGELLDNRLKRSTNLKDSDTEVDSDELSET